MVDDIIVALKAEYKKRGMMTISLDLSRQGKFVINVEKYLNEIMKDLPDDMSRTATSPAVEHLYKTRDNAVKLCNDPSELFHRVTAWLLFLCKRAHPNIQTAISIQFTRVKQPDHDDYKTLAREIKYLCRTKFIHVTMEATHLDQNHWFVD